jgi:hypothetical protein
MSGLAALLAGHDEPDVYRWHNAARVHDVQHAVEKAGWSFVYLDGWTVEDKESFLKATSTALGLPDERESFDALSDSLGDVSSEDAGGIVMLWDGWSPLARADEQAFRVALSVLGGRCHAERRGRFAVLLRGDGPHIDVPELPDAPH